MFFPLTFSIKVLNNVCLKNGDGIKLSRKFKRSLIMKGRYIEFESVGNAVLKEYDVPQPQAGEILIENDYTVISAGTERANLIQLPNTVTAERGFPHCGGYSGSGKVCAIGDGVEDFKIGDRVITSWGTHRTHIIKKASQILKIEDDSIDLVDAAFATIASFSFLGVRKLKIELGESAMVAGMGILGAFAVQIASISGAIPVGVLDFDPTRRDLALKLGADYAVSPDDENIIDKVKEMTGGNGPNAVVEVSGSSAALQQALEYIAWEGRISLLGCTRISDVPIDFYKYVHRRGISLIGAHTMTRSNLESAPGHWTYHDDFRTFLKLVAAKKLQIQPLISEIVSPEAAPAVYARLAEEKEVPLGIVFDWNKIR
jgi:2-desacetyl-2-hydroxyethyl bacteriochlorophyllide A dehydrogenase